MKDVRVTFTVTIADAAGTADAIEQAQRRVANWSPQVSTYAEYVMTGRGSYRLDLVPDAAATERRIAGA